MAKRIGITMRVDCENPLQESRDALAHDWHDFFKSTLSANQDWLLLPNRPSDIIAFADSQKIDGIILSGGNDIGDSPRRDETERTLLAHAEKKHIPLLGICRGMQMIQSYYGGKLSRVNENHSHNHIHAIKMCGNFLPAFKIESNHSTNSFHNWGVKENEMVKPLEAFALSTDGFVEGLVHRDAKIAGIQWHPERRNSCSEFDRILFASFFGV